MSSSPLYLAIVVVWLIVLLPMLLRKDAVQTVHEDQRREDEDPEVIDDEDSGDEGRDDDSDGVGEESGTALDETRVIRRRGAAPAAEHVDAELSLHAEGSRSGSPSHPGRHRLGHESRAKIIARRRRRTSMLTLVNVSTIVAVAFGLGPWWVIAPPVLLLFGHLTLLREAAKADAERRQARLRARRRAVLRARRAQEEERRDAEREAEVIALRERYSQVYDQYADARLRAAGD